MKRILVADDSLFMRLSIKKILIKHGLIIAGEAENGKVAVSKYKELRPDIVTMDITMSEMNGLEALREIREFDDNAKVLMVSAMGQGLFVEEALAYGAKGFLVKPFDEAQVIATINAL